MVLLLNKQGQKDDEWYFPFRPSLSGEGEGDTEEILQTKL